MNTEQYYLMRVGLLLGNYMDEAWVEDLYKCKSLQEMADMINLELDTNITQGMPCEIVHEMVAKELDIESINSFNQRWENPPNV